MNFVDGEALRPAATARKEKFALLLSVERCREPAGQLAECFTLPRGVRAAGAHDDVPTALRQAVDA